MLYVDFEAWCGLAFFPGIEHLFLKLLVVKTSCLCLSATKPTLASRPPTRFHFPSPRTPEVAVCFIESLSWMTALSSWPAWPSFPWCVKRKVSTGLWELNSTLLKVLSGFPEVKQIWPYPRSIPLAVPQTAIEFLDVLGKGIEASVMGWIRAISLAPSIFLLSPVACVFLSRLGTQSLFCWEHIRWSLWTYTIWIV